MTAATARPLGRITAFLADLGLEVTYAYDDLIFVQHCAVVLQFTEQPAKLDIYCNIECTPEEVDAVGENIVAAGRKAGFEIVPKGTFTLSQKDDTIKLEFS